MASGRLPIWESTLRPRAWWPSRSPVMKTTESESATTLSCRLDWGCDRTPPPSASQPAGTGNLQERRLGDRRYDRGGDTVESVTILAGP
jgi:hypothetical protein